MDGPTYTVGEEVLYRGDRYVVAGRREGPYGYRLLASGEREPAGERIVWAAEADLAPIEAYTAPRDDTD